MNTPAPPPDLDWLEDAADLPDDGERIALPSHLAGLSPPTPRFADLAPSPPPKPAPQPLLVPPKPMPPPAVERLPPVAERVAPLPVAAVIEPPGDEHDITWRGYPMRAALPGVVVAALLGAAWHTEGVPRLPTWLPEKFHDLLTPDVVYAPVVAVAMVVVVQMVVRWLGYGMRLTSQRAYQDRGILYEVEDSIDLATVVRVRVQRGLFGWFVGVGRVVLVSEDEAVPPFALWYVGLPGRFGKRVMELAHAAREGNVVGVRVG